MIERTTTATAAVLEGRVAALEGALAAARVEIESLTKERDHLRASHERLRLELEMLKRRIFIAKAERVDTAQLELEFAEKLRQLDALAGTLGLPEQEAATGGAGTGDGQGEGEAPKNKPRPKPKGRRDVSKLPLEEVRIEVLDPVYEDLIAQGKAKRIDFEESAKLGWKRGGMRRVVLARAKYQVIEKDGETSIDTAEMPAETFPRSLAAPSLVAHIIVEKFCDGLPLFRIEDRFARDGVPVDRGTLCRWVEDAGATAGATVIAAARREAFSEAFCIATDATGISVQPIRTKDKARNACRRGHYFVHVADRDHVFFEYTPKETSAAVARMFKGFGGVVQADAKSVYDILFREPEDTPPDDDECPRPTEMGCWVHLRRKFWEAACAKIPSRGKGSRDSAASSSSTPAGRTSRHGRSSACAKRTCVPMPRRSSPGPRSSTSASVNSAACSAPRSATRSGRRAR